MLALTLLGPYLPILGFAGIVGIDVADGLESARLDNLAIPAVAIYLLVRSLVDGELHVPIPTIWYAVFLGWIALMTLAWWSNLPTVYADSSTRGVGLLRSMDAYVRPMLVLLIAANVRINRYDFTMLIRLIVGVGVALGVIAAAQLHGATSGPVNRFLFDYYDNNPGNHFWAVLEGGRAAALMPQLSTLGMYAVLAFGLIAAQVMGGRTISSRLIFGIVVGGVFLAGVMSGSKVFVGGVVLLALGLVFTLKSFRPDGSQRIYVGLLAILIVWSFMFVAFEQQTERTLGMALPDQSQDLAGQSPGDESSEARPMFLERVYDRYIDRYYTAYFASRFETSTGKVFRTGAVDIASDYPITGLGLNVANRTTDSMALGIFIMGGAIGSFLYLGMLATVALRLFRIARGKFDSDLAAVARVLLILTFVFLLMSVAFHTFIQDRAGDAYWLMVGLLLGPLTALGVSGTTGGHGERLD